MKTKQSVSIIGAGRVGGALAIALSAKGYEINCLVSNTVKSAKNIASQLKSKPLALASEEFEKIPPSQILFITTPDSQIQNIAQQLAEKENLRGQKTFVLHTSGALSSEVLTVLKNKGCAVGSLHPLVSISNPKLGVKRFKDAFFCIEGDDKACRLAKKIAKDLGGKSFSINTKFKTLYHASAVMACGHLTALFDMSLEVLQTCGLDQKQANKILLPLVKSTIENLIQQTPAQSLTGTFARADIDTMKRHLTDLKENTSIEILEIYIKLGFRSLDLARKEGGNIERINEMRKILKNE